MCWVRLEHSEIEDEIKLCGCDGSCIRREEGERAVALLASPLAPTEMPFGWQMPSALHSSDHTKRPPSLQLHGQNQTRG